MKVDAFRVKQLDARATQAEITDYRTIVGSAVVGSPVATRHCMCVQTVSEADFRPSHCGSDEG